MFTRSGKTLAEPRLSIFVESITELFWPRALAWSLGRQQASRSGLGLEFEKARHFPVHRCTQASCLHLLGGPLSEKSAEICALWTGGRDVKRSIKQHGSHLGKPRPQHAMRHTLKYERSRDTETLKRTPKHADLPCGELTKYNRVSLDQGLIAWTSGQMLQETVVTCHS